VAAQERSGEVWVSLAKLCTLRQRGEGPRWRQVSRSYVQYLLSGGDDSVDRWLAERAGKTIPVKIE
jgi:hypothetical protein